MAKNNNIDKSNMREVIIQSPDQLINGLDLAKNVKIEGQFKNIIICGLGGSALPANIVASLIKIPTSLYIHRNYGLPTMADKDSLVICISYSGNTEETLSAMEEATKNNYKIIAVATGGKIEEASKKNNIPFVKIPSGIQPRSATGYIFSVLATILTNCGIIEDVSAEILNTAEELKKLNGTLEKKGKALGKKLVKKIPIVYASDNFKAAARIWKIKFNENSKVPSFYNYFPELNHNEMVGFTGVKKSSNFAVIIIKDKNDHERTLKRMDLTSSILKKKGVKTEFINTENGSLMLRFLSVLLLGDWTSYYLSINSKMDPTPVKMVEEFKEKMKA